MMSFAMPRHLWSVVTLLMVGLMLPGPYPPAEASQDAAVAASPVPSPLRWEPCAEFPDTECAGLEVPVDPARPDGPQLTLRLARQLALDPAQRKGSLLFIPGGPGVGFDTLFGGDYPARYHLADWRQSYDVVSFDPRGVGQSNPIRCDPDLVPPAITSFDRPPSATEFEAIGQANAAFMQSCLEASGELVDHLSSRHTAADIERIRQAIGQEDGLFAYASSYGTLFSQMYLERYGAHVKALVLDGITPHSIDLATDAGRGVMAVQEAFARFGQWCEEDPTCALHGQDLGRAFDDAIAIRPVVRTLVPQLLVTGRDPQLGWPALATMLAQVSRGDTTELDQLLATASMASGAADPWLRAGKEGLIRGVLCADFGPLGDHAALTAAGEAIVQEVPRFAWKFWDATPTEHRAVGVGVCVGWPTVEMNPPRDLQVSAHPNVMVANSAYDTTTPLANALNVWLQIPEARLLLTDVDGHQSMLWSQCAFETMFRFLEDPSSVPTTTLCPG
jgi:pimeloyl-ACP methyl ester carboxylesterase